MRTRFSHFFLFGLLLTAGLSASTLKYYSDEVHYQPDNNLGFVGFDSRVKVECDGSSMPVAPMAKIPQNCSLCEAYGTLETVRERLEAVTVEKKLLDDMSAKTTYENMTADQLIENANKLARRKASLSRDNEALVMEQKASQKTFETAGLRSDVMPLFTTKACMTPTFIIPSYTLRIEPRNVAYVKGDRITVTERLTLQNRSGVDIDANQATLYTYPLHESMQTLQFSAWVIHESARRSRTAGKVFEAERMPMQEPAVMAPAAPAKKASVRQVSRVSDKRYELQNVVLPADGSRIDVDVGSWTVGVTSDRIVYPYSDQRVYMTYLFDPESRIQSGAWEVNDGEMRQKGRFGRYEAEHYRLYGYIDRDVKIMRKRLIHKKEDGFFSGPKKQDGYELTLINLSNEVKTLHVVERIPVSTTEKIEVKSVRVTPMQMRVDRTKEGRLDIWLTLEKRQTRKVKVTFMIEHDSSVKPVY